MLSWLKPDTLRKQIFFAYTSILLIILFILGLYFFNQVSYLLKKNTEAHMINTAVQANNNIELILEQIDNFASQVVTNASVQSLLQNWKNGIEPSFEEVQALQREVRRLEVYQKGIQSIEIYNAAYESYLPITNEYLNERYGLDLITRTNTAAGKLIWFDNEDVPGESLVAMSNIRLMNQSFERAGYLVLHIDSSLFALTTGTKEKEEYFWLTDKKGQVIYTNANSSIQLPIDTTDTSMSINGKEYSFVSSYINSTGWNIHLLTSATTTTEGLSVLQATIPVALFISCLLFLVLSYMLSGVISKPILNLIKTMRSARLGSLKPTDIKSSVLEITELNYTYNQMVDSLNALIQVVYEKEILQSKTELKALQAQINPHFLFNTLDAFYWELEENNQPHLAEIIVAMSGVFRYVINKNDNEQWVTIGDELEHAERYLRIMKMRLMDRFTWTIDCTKSLKYISIPKLTIQPIIENAIEHGIEQSLEQGKLHISVRQEEESVVIAVKDSGPGFSEERLSEVLNDLNSTLPEKTIGKERGTNHLGVGLSNTHQRLRLYYGQDDARLNIINSEDGVVIEVHIPMR